MRVAVASQQVGAYGAIAFSLPKDGAATVVLKVAQMSGNSKEQLNKVLACPTKTDDWKPGDDQDGATAPGYSCDIAHFVGKLADDGSSYTFLVDGAAETTEGVLSLAIVPEQTTQAPVLGTDTGLDVTPPFVVDFAKPDSSSLTVTSGGSSTAPPPPPPAPSGAGAGATGSSGAGGATTPSLPSGAGAVSAPTAPDTGQTPVVAGQQPAQQTPLSPAAQQGAQPSSSTSDNKRNILFLLLGALAFAFLYTQNATQRAPRALVGPNAAAAGDETLVAAAAAGLVPARGLGRFNRPRSGPARPLI
jgi:hypothetical protein